MAARTAARPGRRRSGAGRRALTGWAFAGPATAIVLGIGLLPIIWQASLSTQRSNGFAPPTPAGLANYRALARSGEATDAIVRSLVFTALYVPITLALGLALALLLTRRVRLIALYRTAFFVPFVASAAATGVVFNYLLDPQYGIVNGLLQVVGLPRQGFLEDPDQALLLLVPIATWGAVGLDMLVFLAALSDVPRDQLEAVLVDGGGRWHAFRHVTVPALMPVTVLLVVWETINALQLFDLAWTTTRGGPLDATTVIVVLAYKLAFVVGRVGEGAAMAIVLLVAIAVLTLGQAAYARARGIDAF